MESLHIDPHTLPAQPHGDWDTIFQAGPGPQQHPMESAELAASQRHMAAQGSSWVNDFERMQLNGPQQQWASEFAQQVSLAWHGSGSVVSAVLIQAASSIDIWCGCT